MTTEREQILALAGEPTEFKRENKYLVLKLGDIAKFLTRDEQFKLDELIKKIRVGRLNDGKQDQSYVCVASDWPMYEQVWAAVQAFVEGKPSQIDELRQQLAAAQAQITLLKSHVANVKSNLMYQRRFGTDTFQCWVNAAARAEGDLEEALALPANTTALETMIQKAGEVMRERSATVCDKRSTYYGRASAESQEAKDCAFNIRALPGVKLEDLK